MRKVDKLEKIHNELVKAIVKNMAKYEIGLGEVILAIELIKTDLLSQKHTQVYKGK